MCFIRILYFIILLERNTNINITVSLVMVGGLGHIPDIYRASLRQEKNNIFLFDV